MFLEEIPKLAEIAQRFPITLIQRNRTIAHISVVRIDRTTAAIGGVTSAWVRGPETARSVLAALSALLATGLLPSLTLLAAWLTLLSLLSLLPALLALLSWLAGLAGLAA